jgi:arginyl-tRNA synthetase
MWRRLREIILKFCWIFADEDPEFAVKSRNTFSALENRDQDNVDIWEMCRVLTIKELENNYLKLNVEFDHYYGESMYSSDKSKQVIQRLGDEDLVKDMDDGRKVINLDEKNIVTIIKSDGTSLYITRDIAAALDRREKFGLTR